MEVKILIIIIKLSLKCLLTVISIGSMRDDQHLNATPNYASELNQRNYINKQNKIVAAVFSVLIIRSIVFQIVLEFEFEFVFKKGLQLH